MNDQPSSTQERLAANLAQVHSHITGAAQRAGRSPADITLVAVSKTVPLDLVQIAYNLGVTDFGENRVQDALPKIAEFHPPGMRWHMIGHLQRTRRAKLSAILTRFRALIACISRRPCSGTPKSRRNACRYCFKSMYRAKQVRKA